MASTIRRIVVVRMRGEDRLGVAALLETFAADVGWTTSYTTRLNDAVGHREMELRFAQDFPDEATAGVAMRLLDEALAEASFVVEIA